MLASSTSTAIQARARAHPHKINEFLDFVGFLA